MRILVGNEPPTYRHFQAETFRALRPTTEVVIVEPAGLDRAVASFTPHLVLCSTLSEVIQTQPLSWILLYPDGANLAIASVAGKQRIIPQVGFEDLLAVVDETLQHLALNETPEVPTPYRLGDDVCGI